MPHWFANLSDRLATHNGIMLMGLSALAALLYTGGKVDLLVIMYSINVFLTFSLSMIGMCRHWWQERGANPLWRRHFVLFLGGAVMCLSILGITVYGNSTKAPGAHLGCHRHAHWHLLHDQPALPPGGRTAPQARRHARQPRPYGKPNTTHPMRTCRLPPSWSADTLDWGFTPC